MKKIFYLLILLLASPSTAQTTLEDADNAYMQEHYQEAAEIYEAALLEGASADVYYNLGNTYYRLKEMGKAVLNYERALMLEPGNEDIRYNLDICKSKAVDQFNKPSEMFFITWFKELIYSKNADQWGTIGLVSLVLAMLCFGLYRFSGMLSLRKIGFFVGVVLFISAVLTNIAAALSYYAYTHDQRAVVLSVSSLYKASNDKEEPLRELNAGTTVEVVEENSKGWCEILLPNGKKGWVKQETVAKIKE